MTTVRTEVRDDGIAVVTLDRPDRLNALSSTLLTDLKDAFGALRHDRSARVVVLTGEGRGFCAGTDLSGERDPAPDAGGRGPIGTIYRTQQHVAEAVLAVHECPKPVIAAVHGPAVGGGLALALAADLRVATPSTKFGAVFINVGLSSCDVGVSYLLPRAVGPTRAAELMLTGRHFSGEEAMGFGMLNALADDGGHLDRALELAALVARQHEFGLEFTKSGLHAAIDATSLRAAMELENRTQALGTFGGNFGEAMAAFADKRPPTWSPM
ncbi:enoyl-CoA hydratase/isomerase family protein [soil metagenome]